LVLLIFARLAQARDPSGPEGLASLLLGRRRKGHERGFGMKTHRLVLLGIGSLVALMAACGGEAIVEDTTSSGRGGSGTTGPASGTGAQTTGTTSVGQGGGSGIVCGGFAGSECPANEYCDYEPSTCGATDGTGICRTRPSGCPDIYSPTCACDGMVYGNDCDAAANGFDINLNGGCAAPPGMFGCGAQFCDLTAYYCEILGTDVGSEPNVYSCQPLPTACGSAPSCACLAGVQCGSMCTGNAAQGLTALCPGG
jgi:hypothetical protein